jgi:hypothetical protein
MLGIGDNLHQRAALRELMKTNDVWLETYNCAMYHDLEQQGLKMLPRTPPRIRETSGNGRVIVPAPPAPKLRITYNRAAIESHGSILAAIFSSFGLAMPAAPDFSLPIPQTWTDKAKQLINSWPVNGKPLMMYRPVILNSFWRCDSRSPDPEAYAALFAKIRHKFFVVSFADLATNKEWIVGPEQAADVKLHAGELDFETMAALFAEADLVFANAGFSPVLAQAVRTPLIVVYGGHESSKTTQRTGAHLAPTLCIDTDNPCDCHRTDHDCDKRIDLERAHSRIAEFIKNKVLPRVLIFGTTYVDDQHKATLLERWFDLNRSLNSDCDIMIVDSQSPFPLIPDLSEPILYYGFSDNIGHLARGGRDGWGRAFCYGLNAAIEGGYDYVVHIEGDSLFRLPVMPIVRQMKKAGTAAASIPVSGLTHPQPEWVETGLMFFNVEYLSKANFVAGYDWPNRTPVPTPEAVVRKLLGGDLTLMPWRGQRDDKNEITGANVQDFNLDWLTHCRDPIAYERFAMVKLNFGCGTNELPGWQNFDAEVDIAKPLPFPDSHADFIFCEHCIEHVDYYAAIEFLRECRRVLKPGGIVRIATPSIEQIMHGDQDYFDFTTKWQPDAIARGAMNAIVYYHGHRSVWTGSLLQSTIYLAGFKDVTACAPHVSAHDALTNVEGHHRVIGEHMNEIETCVVEGTAEK